jgi:hypothetical protein
MTLRDDGATTMRSTGRTRGLRPPWRPGQSGNPSGHNVSFWTLAAQIRRASGDGQEIVDFLFAVMRGGPIVVPGRRAPLVPRLEHRMQAAVWLADRGWGKARDTIELKDEEDEKVSRERRLAIVRAMTEDERAQLRELLERAQARIESQAASAAPAPLEPEARLPPHVGPS